MTISATAVRFDDHTMWVGLSDGRTIGVPLAWFPRLLRATPEQRDRVEISRVGLHWEEIDEDISIDGLLAGRGDMTRQAEKAVWFFSCRRDPSLFRPTLLSPLPGRADPAHSAVGRISEA